MLELSPIKKNHETVSNIRIIDIMINISIVIECKESMR